MEVRGRKEGIGVSSLLTAIPLLLMQILRLMMPIWLFLLLHLPCILLACWGIFASGGNSAASDANSAASDAEFAVSFATSSLHVACIFGVSSLLTAIPLLLMPILPLMTPMLLLLLCLQDTMHLEKQNYFPGRGA